MCVKSVPFGPTAGGCRPNWKNLRCIIRAKFPILCLFKSFNNLRYDFSSANTHAWTFPQGAVIWNTAIHRAKTYGRWKTWEKAQSRNAWFTMTTCNKWTWVLKLEPVSKTISHCLQIKIWLSPSPRLPSSRFQHCAALKISRNFPEANLGPNQAAVMGNSFSVDFIMHLSCLGFFFRDSVISNICVIKLLIVKAEDW